MRIAISGMFWREQTVGSGQYLHALLDALARVAPEHEYVVLLPAYREPCAALGRSNVQMFERSNVGWSPVVVRTPFDRRSGHAAKLWYEQIGVPLAAARLRVDLLHVPYFAPPLVAPVPVVASVLDLIPLLLPEYRGGARVRAY